MRFTSKTNIERIIEIYSRNNTKNANKLMNFLNANQGSSVKVKPRRDAMTDELNMLAKIPEGTISYEEMKIMKAEAKEAQRKLQQSEGKKTIITKSNKYFEQKKALNEEAKSLLKDSIVRTYFKGISDTLVKGNIRI